MEKIRFGIIGCGRIFDKHLEAIRQNKDASLVAVCDITADRAKHAAKRAGDIPFYTSYDDMLIKEEIDVVNILTPSGHHAECAIDIIKKYKKHIICEKPMALKLDDADRMIRVCDENGVRLFVVKQNRYNLPVQKLKDANDQGKFGKLVLGTVRVRWSRNQSYYDQDEWRGTWKLDGGVLTNQASHHIDLLEWLFGEPVSVMAKMGTFLSNIEVEDTAAAIIKFKSGALGIVEATTATRPKDLEGSISVLGEKGSVVIGGFAVNKMITWEFEGQSEEEKQHVLSSFSENPPNVYGFGHTRYLENVIHCIKTKTKALVDGLEGRKSLELINAFYESAETEREIFLRFVARKSKLGE